MEVTTAMSRQLIIAKHAILSYAETGGDPARLRETIEHYLNLVAQHCHAGLTLSDAGMPGPLLDALARNNVCDLLTLLRHTRKEIRCMPGIGDTRAYQIESALLRHGLRLREGPVDAECF